MRNRIIGFFLISICVSLFIGDYHFYHQRAINMEPKDFLQNQENAFLTNWMSILALPFGILGIALLRWELNAASLFKASVCFVILSLSLYSSIFLPEVLWPYLFAVHVIGVCVLFYIFGKESFKSILESRKSSKLKFVMTALILAWFGSGICYCYIKLAKAIFGFDKFNQPTFSESMPPGLFFPDEHGDINLQSEKLPNPQQKEPSTNAEF